MDYRLTDRLTVKVMIIPFGPIELRVEIGHQLDTIKCMSQNLVKMHRTVLDLSPATAIIEPRSTKFGPVWPQFSTNQVKKHRTLGWYKENNILNFNEEVLNLSSRNNIICWNLTNFWPLWPKFLTIQTCSKTKRCM